MPEPTCGWWPQRVLSLQSCRSPSREVACGGMDRRADAHIGGAATDIAVHGGVDVRVGRLCVARQQADRRHDLARLAVAALDHVELLPRGLDRLGDLSVDPFDGGDLLADRVADLGLARAG